MKWSRSRLRAALALALLAVLPASWSQAETVVEFGPGQLDGWRLETFPKLTVHTDYAEVDDPSSPAGGRAIDARSAGGVAGYVYESDLPFALDAEVALSYQVVAARNPADERAKAGDDFPLRFYLTAKTGLFSYETLVLVHSLQSPAGSHWTNPYSQRLARFEMHAVAGSEDALGEWRELVVPVGLYWRERFGSVPDELVALGVMVDSDNAGGMMHTRIAGISYRSR